MPRTARKPEHIQEVKERILAAATELICDDGLDQLSMRKLGARLGMTATNIYNYYGNKAELYLDIQTRGFELLGEAFAAVVEAEAGDPVERLVGFARAYVDFGIGHADYYEVMLGSNTPKYADYVGTDMEPAALREKQMAVAVIDLAERSIEEATRARRISLPFAPRVYALRLWATLHGIVSLLHTRVLPEVTDDHQPILDTIVHDIRATFAAPRPGREEPT